MTSKPNKRRPLPAVLNHHKTYRWMRQFHLWIGAWGALGAVLYGFTGLILNHRIGEHPWPQGDSVELGSTTLSIPAEARTSPEELSLWLQRTRGLDVQVIRKGSPGERGGGRRNARGPGDSATTANERTRDQAGTRGNGGAPPKWSLSGGTAADSWQLEYMPGSDSAQLKRSQQSFLAAINRLHKTVGGGMAWRVLSDTLAIAMVLLGITGIWIWARGRTYRQMAVSVFGVGALVFLVVVIPALL